MASSGEPEAVQGVSETARWPEFTRLDFVLLATSRHVQLVFPLHVRGATLYPRPWEMQQLFTKLIHTVHVNKASCGGFCL